MSENRFRHSLPGRSTRGARSDEAGFGLLEVLIAVAIVAAVSMVGLGMATTASTTSIDTAQRLQAGQLLSATLDAGATGAVVHALGTTFTVTVTDTVGPAGTGTALATGTCTWVATGGLHAHLTMSTAYPPSTIQAPSATVVGT